MQADDIEFILCIVLEVRGDNSFMMFNRDFLPLIKKKIKSVSKPECNQVRSDEKIR